MARPREFDEEAVTEAAMNVFWEHGYDVTSITMLQDATGLTTGSLYKAFKDKKSLFLIAMRRYEAKQVAQAVVSLTNSDIKDPLDRIEAMFRSVPEDVRKGDRRGCLLCSAAAGPSFDDDDIAAEVDRLMGQLREGFQTALAQTVGDDEIGSLARLLLAQYVGLRTLARAQLPASELDQTVAAVVDMVRTARAS